MLTSLSIPHSKEIAAFLSRWQIALLAAITALGLILRAYDLPNMPPGLHVDEAWLGVMAREVLQTGRLTPFFATNQGVEAMVVYVTAPVIALLGDQETWHLRIPMVAAGTLTIPALWWLCREVPGRRSAGPDNPPSEDEFVFSSLLGLGSGLALAILFWHISLSRIALEPILVPLTLCVAFALLARALETRRWFDFALAGAALGANIYTYKAGYAAPVLAAVYLGYLAVLPHPLRPSGTPPPHAGEEDSHRAVSGFSWRAALIIFGAALIVAIPMIIYAAQNPGDFLTRFNSVALDKAPSQPVDLGQNALGTLGMFFVAGDRTERYNIPGRPALDPLMAILFLVGCVRAALALRSPRLGFSLVWLAIMSLPTLFADFAPQWGRAIGATPMIALLCALGGLTIWQAAGGARRRWVAAAGIGVVAAITVLSGFIAVRDYFAVYSQGVYLFYSNDEGNVKVSQYINSLPGDQRIYLVTPLTQYWVFTYLIQHPYTTYDGRFGTVYPAPGQTATLVITFPSGRDLFRTVSSTRPDAQAAWELKDRAGHTYARALMLPASDHPAPTPEHPLGAQLGDSIRLLGYGANREQITPGGSVTVTITWQALKTMHQNYTVFVQLYAAQPAFGSDGFLAGIDHWPVNAQYPTVDWQPGETILDQYIVNIPDDAPPGTYRIMTGVYRLETMARLEAVGADGQRAANDAIELGTIQVAK